MATKRISLNELRTLVKRIIKEEAKINTGRSNYTDFYLVVNFDERGDYSATVYDPEDDEVYSIDSAEHMMELIDDGFLKYKADEDLGRLAEYLAYIEVIPSGSQIYHEDEFEYKYLYKGMK